MTNKFNKIYKLKNCYKINCNNLMNNTFSTDISKMRISVIKSLCGDDTFRIGPLSEIILSNSAIILSNDEILFLNSRVKLINDNLPKN